MGILYESIVKSIPPSTVMERHPVPYERFVTERIIGIESDRDSIDQVITRYAVDWRLERLNPVDRSILYLGVWEILRRPDVPHNVAIAEAVRLADEFSTEDSARFVNGILAAVAEDSRRDA